MLYCLRIRPGQGWKLLSYMIRYWKRNAWETTKRRGRERERERDKEKTKKKNPNPIVFNHPFSIQKFCGKGFETTLSIQFCGKNRALKLSFGAKGCALELSFGAKGGALELLGQSSNPKCFGRSFSQPFEESVLKKPKTHFLVFLFLCSFRVGRGETNA